MKLNELKREADGLYILNKIKVLSRQETYHSTLMFLGCVTRIVRIEK